MKFMCRVHEPAQTMAKVAWPGLARPKSAAAAMLSGLPDNLENFAT